MNIDVKSTPLAPAHEPYRRSDVSLPDLARQLDAEARHFDTSHAGRRVAWRVWGEGAPVVLIHGGFGSWTHWIKTIPHLAVRRMVIAPDMPGFGDSDLPAGDDLLQAIPRALIEGLPAALGKSRHFDLVGFSFGTVMAGQLAAELGAADAPARVDSLVLVAPAGLGLHAMDFKSLARTRPGMTRDDIASVHRHNMAIILFKDPSAIDETALDLQIANTARARTKGRRYSRSNALMTAAGRIQARNLVAVWGEGDAYVQREKAAYEAAVAGLRPDIRIHRIAAGGHWIQYEAASAFNAFLTAALDGRGKT